MAIQKPISWASKIILVKPEALNAYGVDVNPTGAANAMLLTDVTFQPMVADGVSRNLDRAKMGAQEEVPTGLRATLSGQFEMVGSGTLGVAPAWSPIMRALGVVEVITPNTNGDGKVEYHPVSDDHESACCYIQIGMTLHKLLGGRGTGQVSMNAQGIPVCRFTLTFLFTQPVEAARPTVDQSKWQKPEVVTARNTPVFKIAGLDFAMRSYTLDLACDVQPRMLVGVERILIVDRNETLACTVEAVPVTYYNPYQRAEQLTPTTVSIEHGKIEGRRVKIDVTNGSQKSPGSIENQQKVAEWPLMFSVLPGAAGDDQWKITLT
ncbi:hypothetical protein [Sphingomonas panni]|uniref:hypothetical protein n=1 Tax=Sphingomonas panni TaxID=237612 RepID=UPI001F5B7AD5|nr:hypothetical protein [Sphingomonas panni]